MGVLHPLPQTSISRCVHGLEYSKSFIALALLDDPITSQHVLLGPWPGSPRAQMVFEAVLKQWLDSYILTQAPSW